MILNFTEIMEIFDLFVCEHILLNPCLNDHKSNAYLKDDNNSCVYVMIHSLHLLVEK